MWLHIHVLTSKVQLSVYVVFFLFVLFILRTVLGKAQVTCDSMECWIALILCCYKSFDRRLPNSNSAAALHC